MLASGNIVDVRFQDRPRYLQPAGIYWLEAIAVEGARLAAGSDAPRHQAWAYRIPSLLAGVANVLLTASIGTALFGPEAGLLAGVLLAVSVLFNAEGRMATIDTVLLTSVLVAERALLAAFQDRLAGRATPRRTGLVFWAAIGAGLMLKGPVILIPAFGTLAALLAGARSLDLWRRLRPRSGLPLALLIVLPWCVAILVVSHGTFFADAVGTNLLGKVTRGQQAHGAPPGTYLAMFLAAFWPGSIFAALAIPFAWAERRRPAVVFALAAILPHWIVYELIATKLPHYVLPAYPAIACVTAAALLAPRPARWRSARAAIALYGALWTVAGLAFAVAGPLLLWRLQGEVSAVAIADAAVAAGLVVAATVLLLCRARLAAFGASALAATTIYASLFLLVLPELGTIWLSPRIADTVRLVRPCPDSVLASVSFSEPSLVFLAGRRTKLVPAAAAAGFLAADRACGLALVGTRDEGAFRAALTVPVRPLATIDGINYSNGRRLHLTLYRAAP